MFQVSMCAKCKCDHVHVNATDEFVHNIIIINRPI